MILAPLLHGSLLLGSVDSLHLLAHSIHDRPQLSDLGLGWALARSEFELALVFVLNRLHLGFLGRSESEDLLELLRHAASHTATEPLSTRLTLGTRRWLALRKHANRDCGDCGRD